LCLVNLKSAEKTGYCPVEKMELLIMQLLLLIVKRYPNPQFFLRMQVLLGVIPEVYYCEFQKQHFHQGSTTLESEEVLIEFHPRG
jgi:hypothetical protein